MMTELEDVKRIGPPPLPHRTTFTRARERLARQDPPFRFAQRAPAPPARRDWQQRDRLEHFIEGAIVLGSVLLIIAFLSGWPGAAS